ncbi:MAG: hypothetical protein ACKVU2_04930 [Saprospiraceae bacterium]
MKLNTTTFVLIAASLIFSNCNKDEPAATAQILPGVGITGIKIGQPAQQAIDVYGTVAPSSGGAGGTYTHFLLYLSQGVVVYCEISSSATFSPTMLVDRINLTAPYSGKTEKGIGIGSTKTAVEAAYGAPVSSSAFFGDTFSNGLRVLYDSAGTVVEEITVE